MSVVQALYVNSKVSTLCMTIHVFVLVTSQPLPPVGYMGHVISHMTNVHGDTAVNALHATAKSKHVCTEVMPEDIRVLFVSSFNSIQLIPSWHFDIYCCTQGACRASFVVPLPKGLHSSKI